jgi:SAM-dependent methyltransferase
MPVTDPTQRFSSRVGNYVRYRPGYPSAVVDLLRKECGLTSGTGIFTRMLLENGNRVYGIEPNAEMRKAGEEFLGAYSRFTSVEGAAEATTLADGGVDLVTAAQAAHWFDREKARREFIRICRRGGWTVLLWNERPTQSTPFLRGYEQLLLAYGTETFFAPSPFQVRTFEYQQAFDYPALEGRLLSSSYTPQADDSATSPCCANCGGCLMRTR